MKHCSPVVLSVYFPCVQEHKLTQHDEVEFTVQNVSITVACV